MNILTPLQKNLLKYIGKSELGKKFVWTGGTALARRLEHRYSIDLDFFSENLEAPEIFLSHINRLQKALALKQIKYEEKLNRRLFIMEQEKEQIQLEFVYFPFSPIEKPKKDAEFGIRIDSLIDIAVNKILSSYQRKEPKDAYDLYVLCAKKKFNLKKLINFAHKKFGVSIDQTSLIAKILDTAKQLQFIEPLYIKKEKNIQQRVINFFQKYGNKYLMSILVY